MVVQLYRLQNYDQIVKFSLNVDEMCNLMGLTGLTLSQDLYDESPS